LYDAKGAGWRHAPAGYHVTARTSNVDVLGQRTGLVGQRFSRRLAKVVMFAAAARPNDGVPVKRFVVWI
jgi:hypothetical protein